VSFQNGHVKLGGRKAGTRNRSFSVRERLEQLDCDPLEECIKIAQSNESSNELKAKIWLGILDYTAPKLRAIDQTIGGPDGQPPQIEIIRVEFKPPPAGSQDDTARASAYGEATKAK
jgi:hypothetical protein